MDSRIKDFLASVSSRTGGRIAPDYLPAVILVRGQPDAHGRKPEGPLAVPRPCVDISEWRAAVAECEKDLPPPVVERRSEAREQTTIFNNGAIRLEKVPDPPRGGCRSVDFR
jgi:hypothetical protein